MSPKIGLCLECFAVSDLADRLFDGRPPRMSMTVVERWLRQVRPPPI